jgi:hypothetical protein
MSLHVNSYRDIQMRVRSFLFLCRTQRSHLGPVHWQYIDCCGCHRSNVPGLISGLAYYFGFANVTISIIHPTRW